MDSTDHKHLQRFCEQRKQNKTIGLHKKEYVEAICTKYNLTYIIDRLTKRKKKKELSFGLL